MVKSAKVKFHGTEWTKKRWKRMMNLTELNLKNKVVLDAGCGSGYKTHRFSQFAKNIYGIDISEKYIKEAKDRYNAKNLFFKVGSVEQIPFQDSTFDVVYSHWVIEHLKEPKKFIDEVYRVLKPEGILILWAPNIKSITGLLTKIIPVSLKIQIVKTSEQRNEVLDHKRHKCYYRANSVHKLDRFCKGKFKRIYLERFDSTEGWPNFRILSYLWFLRHKLLDNKLLNWAYRDFHVEYKKCF